MSRDLDPATQAAAEQPTVWPVLFVQMDFASQTSRVWSGVGPIDWDGHTWQGMGELGEITGIEETATVRAAGIGFRLSGLGPSLLEKAMIGKSEYRRRPVKVWLGFSDATGVPLAPPTLVWSGQMDVMTITAGETLTIDLTAENDLIDLERPRTRRYTPEDQKEIYPDDLGFDYVAALQDMQIKWPNGDG